jgi:2-dehydro-3-deoxyphosphogluconate aldolase/(4S)-4-hydroxy-2-oxoglutarate aldolase
MLKAMSAPYGAIKFMPTGGLNADNILSYLKFNKIICCGGSFMVKDELIKAGDFDKIAELTRGAVNTLLGFEFGHIGINNPDSEEAKKGAETLCKLFGLSSRETSKSIFAGNAFELMTSQGRGTMGHIAIKTNFVDRAIAYFKRIGVAVDESTITYDDKGKPKFVYLQDEICGFAIHLVTK